MTWVKLDDGYPEHLKVVGLSDRAFRADIEGWCYCARNLTDGLVPMVVALRWSRKALTELVAAGRWERLDDGYAIHDYLDYNPSKADVMAAADAKRIAGAKGAAARWHKPNDAPTRPVPDPSPNAEGKGAKAIVDNRPDHDQTYLAEKLAESWDQELGPPALQKLNNAYGRAAVSDALRSLHGFPPSEAVRSVYAYVEEICKQGGEAARASA
jgi:hypothetical protein